MEYDVVYDVIEAGYRYWWFPMASLLATAGARWLVVLGSRPDSGSSRWSRFLAICIFYLMLISTVGCFIGTFWDYLELRNALVSGEYETVEGKVSDFFPMPLRGHAQEQFRVGPHVFSYSDYQVTAGFNNSQSHGGPIREGLEVRIANVNGKIARLEVKKGK
jgi:hypothetical protein